MKLAGMLVGLCIAMLVPGCDSGDSAGVRELRERVEKLEENQQLLLEAMNATARKLDVFLLAVTGEELPDPVGSGTESGTEPVESGIAEPEVQQPTGSEPAETLPAASRVPIELWVSGGAVLLALVLALVALFRSRRSLQAAGPDREAEESVAEASLEMDEGAEETAELSRGEPVGDLSVENVGRGELGLSNIAPVELDEPMFDVAAATALDDPPRSVQWRLSCADPEAGSRLAQELLVGDPRVLAEPRPRVEAEAQSLRVGYHVHPGLTLSDRSQIAARLMEVLRDVPPAVRGGASGRS